MPTSNVNNETSHPTEFDYFTPTIPNRIAFDLSLTVHDLRVYMVVNSFAHTTGDAYASNNWIAKKLGVDRSTIIRSINKLCGKKYIVREDINGHRHLRIFVNSVGIEKQGGVAHVRRGGGTRATGGSQPCDPINNKIINNKNITTTTKKSSEKSKSSSIPIINKEIDEILLKDRKKSLQNDDSKRTEEEYLRQCSHHLDNGDKDKYTLNQRLAGLRAIIRKGFFEKPAGFDEKKIIKSIFSPQETVLIQTYQHALRMEKLGMKIKDFMPDPEEVKKAIKLVEKSESNKAPLEKRHGLMGFSSI